MRLHQLSLFREPLDASKHLKHLKKAVDKQGEIIYAEIDTIIEKMQNEIEHMNIQHLATKNKQEEAINGIINEIQQAILELKRLLYTNEFCLHKTKRHHSVKTERRHSVTFQSPFSRLNGRYISVTIQ